MSDENKHDEVGHKIVISVDDCKNVKEYGTHFGVPIPADLGTALDTFIDDQNYENQQSVKLEMCKWMITSPHESFKDKLWEEPKTLADEIIFDLQFDKDVQDTLDVNKTEEAKKDS